MVEWLWRTMDRGIAGTCDEWKINKNKYIKVRDTRQARVVKMGRRRELGPTDDPARKE